MERTIIQRIGRQAKSRGIVYNYIKRMVDIVVSLVILILTSPIIAISFLIVYLQDFKNPLFSQLRVGVDNNEFKMYKIRSMINNAEKHGAKWAVENDVRITRFGKFIRKTRIDELPQLINVLNGDMSIIGPRPEREIFYKEFEKEIKNFRDRLHIKPGLTGWAQVNGGYDLTPKEKLKLDLFYIDNMGILIDMKIVLMTIKVIFTGDGAR